MEVLDRKLDANDTLEVVAKSVENTAVILQQTGPQETDVALNHVDEDKTAMITLRQQLRLEGLKCQQLKDELQLAQSQLRAEAAARLSLQVNTTQIKIYENPDFRSG